MRSMLGHLVLIICMIGSPSWSVMAKLIKPKSVHQAAYCAEFLRLNRSNTNDQVGEEITKAAAAIIGGGDNIEFAQLGIEDARRKVLSGSLTSVDGITVELQECANSLTEDLKLNGWFICGYGQHSSPDADVKRYLIELELPLPTWYDQPEIKTSLWYRILDFLNV